MLEPLNDSKKKNIVLISVLLTAINVVLVVILVLLLVVASPLTVSGSSMDPTLKDGEHIFILKVGYDIHLDDIVVFEKDDSPKKIIKRVIGIEGDNIRFDPIDNCYIRNGVKLNESYIKSEHGDYYISESGGSIHAQLLSSEGITVKKGELFVLGDNRNISNDSHLYGCIRVDQVIGKYLFRY